MAFPRTNWAGSHEIAGGRLHEPRSLDELRELVAGQDRLRVLGTGHTFNDLPDSRGDLVSLAGMPPRFELGAAGTVTVDAATRYADLSEPLDAAGLALEAMASLGHISVAGACATGTHGSGDGAKSLAAAVAGLEIVTADGTLVEVSRSRVPDELAGAVVSLGAIGVVTSVMLDVVPRFAVRQRVFEDVPLDTVIERFDEITSLAYSVSLFTVWQDRRFHQVWCKERLDAGADWNSDAADAVMGDVLGGRPADGPRHPIPGYDASACTSQLGVPGSWFERLPHFRADRTPSSGHELQSEYLIDRTDAPAALAALFDLSSAIAPVAYVSEVRTIAPDDLWLSPSSGRPSAAIHFTWSPDLPGVLDALSAVEHALAPFDPRPHWGKLWTLPVDAVRASYGRMDAFAELRNRWDPNRTFANRYVDALLGD
jgi:alditol oxidase